ncbi:DUF1254 domain-containing protein [Bdellovibrio sp. ArHS]|uniref:DUF1254 domain-containing protein n=1 Tax=Bdellovibrio sp. ArHS TaxID=1569284 RepID=UPI0025BF8D29|nr:DUF1254 domain-containing protein [Bdellovibrio sp. ArHS]
MRLLILVLMVPSILWGQTEDTRARQLEVLAKKATIYAYPLVENARAIYEQFYNRDSKAFKAPVNTLRTVATLPDASFKTPSMNLDVAYGYLLMDLRAEPFVISLPKITKDRYHSVQIMDLYTHNVDYLGTRKDGREEGPFLIVGPTWTGSAAGFRRIIKVETEFALALFRMQIFDEPDLVNVQALQSQYKVMPLSVLQKGTAVQKPALIFPPVLDVNDVDSYFATFNFVLGLSPVLKSEKALRADFESLGLAPGQPFELARLNPEQRAALRKGYAEGLQEIREVAQNTGDTRHLYGTREFFKENYLNRAVGAFLGLYGSSKEEAVTVAWRVDEINEGEKLDGSKYNYMLRFTKNNLPPVRAFWSLTMYDAGLNLVKNPISRYHISSHNLSKLKRDGDGGLTIHLQRTSPGPTKETNWLPTPAGPFVAVLRMYAPMKEVREGQWKKPAMTAVNPSALSKK